jgi:hypothetical protein
VIGGSSLDQLLTAVIVALVSVLVFAHFSACTAVILFGWRGRPVYLRQMSWMLTPPGRTFEPRSAFEWVGLGVALCLTLVMLLMPWLATTDIAVTDYGGPLGKAVLYAAYLPMVAWVVYLKRIYRSSK